MFSEDFRACSIDTGIGSDEPELDSPFGRGDFSTCSPNSKKELRVDFDSENPDPALHLMRQQMLALYQNGAFPSAADILQWYGQSYKQNSSIPVFKNFNLPQAAKYTQLAFVKTNDYYGELRLFLMRVRPEIDKVWQVVASAPLGEAAAK